MDDAAAWTLDLVGSSHLTDFRRAAEKVGDAPDPQVLEELVAAAERGLRSKRRGDVASAFWKALHLVAWSPEKLAPALWDAYRSANVSAARSMLADLKQMMSWLGGHRPVAVRTLVQAFAEADSQVRYEIAFLAADGGDAWALDQVAAQAPAYWVAALRGDTAAFADALDAVDGPAELRAVLVMVFNWFDRDRAGGRPAQLVADGVGRHVTSDDLYCRLVATATLAECAEHGADLGRALDGLGAALRDHRAVTKTPPMAYEWDRTPRRSWTTPLGEVAGYAAKALGYSARRAREAGDPAADHAPDDPSVALLLQALRQGRPSLRRAAARGLGIAAVADDFPTLPPVLASGDGACVHAAVEGVWEGAGTGCAPALATWLAGHGFDPARCAPAAEALRPMRHHLKGTSAEGAVLLVQALFAREDAAVLECITASAGAAVASGDTTHLLCAAPVVAGMLFGDRRASVRDAALTCLKALAGAGASMLPSDAEHAWIAPATGTVSPHWPVWPVGHDLPLIPPTAARRSGEAAAAYAAQLWVGPDAHSRSSALDRLLGLVDDGEAVRVALPAATVALLDPDPAVSRLAAFLVCEMATNLADVRLALPSLVHVAAEHPDEDLRQSFWTALNLCARCHDVALKGLVVQARQRAHGDDSDDVRRAARRVVDRAGVIRLPDA